jgi:two-component system, OmpR family, phosphate regulon sensor histidine kinase PhoR
MHKSLTRLLISAVVAATGLILLQVYWIRHEWRAANDIIQRQVNHAVQEAVAQELKERKDTLRHYLEALFRDTSMVRLSTLYSAPTKTWTIKMADAKNPADFTNFTHKKIPVDSVLSKTQEENIIQLLVNQTVEEDLRKNTIMYYTQRFGKRWSELFDSLSLNRSSLQALVQKQLDAAGINQPFYLQFIDTLTAAGKVHREGPHIASAYTGVQYGSVWDYEHRYVVQAFVKNPNQLLLKRLWLAIAASFLLVMLIIYYMARTFTIIRGQKQLNEIKNDFIDNMTHELKTPLATIHAAIDSLQYYNDRQDEQKATRYFNISRHELVRLNDMLDRILDIAVYENQSLALHKEKIALAPMVEEIVAALRLQYDRSFTISTSRLHEDFEVYADKIHFANIIHNLLENAIKHVQGDLSITITATGGNGSSIITVRDNGPGIPVSAQAHLFEKFYRIPSSNIQNTRGYGLGLYYVKQVLLRHGGEISVKSKPGEGTTFIIKLPAKSDE